MPTRTIKIYHECARGCGKCYGSGEGWDENHSCTDCHGKGTAWDRGEIEEEFEVGWTKDDLSDFKLVDGYPECEYCNENLYECAKETLMWELDNE